MNLKFLRTTLCLAAVAMSAWALPASAASAKGKVSIFLVGERVAGGKKISVDSETRKIKPSKQYTYKLTGTVRGAAKSTLIKLLPNPVSIDKFVEAIAAGELHGVFTQGQIACHEVEGGLAQLVAEFDDTGWPGILPLPASHLCADLPSQSQPRV